jgi:hypothetical protein
MARDNTALTIQGPDNGSGNPIAVIGGGSGGTVTADITMLGTSPIRQDEPGAITTVFSDPNAQIVYMAGVTSTAGPQVPVLAPPSFPGFAISAANAAVSYVQPSVGSDKVTLSLISIQFDGANAQTTFQVFDGATKVLDFVVPASTIAPWFIQIPNGGLTGSNGNTVTLTLGAGGAGIVGRINVAFLIRTP